MKGIVVCASGDDLILVLMCSLNGGKENKPVTNNLVKETRTIWHDLSLNLPKWEGAGGAWHPSLPEGRNASWKVQREAAVARTKIETRRPFAVMLPNRVSTSLRAVRGCELDLTFSRGRKFRLGAALRLSPTLFFPLPFPQPGPDPGKGSLGNIHIGLTTVCQDTDKMNALFTLLLQTLLFKAKMMLAAPTWSSLGVYKPRSAHTHTCDHTGPSPYEAGFGMPEVPFRKIPTLITYEDSMKVKRQE